MSSNDQHQHGNHHGHHGDGHHHHHHHHGHDFAQSNKDYYDQNVDRYENPHWVAANKQQALVVRSAFNFDKNSTAVLDFACGAGTFAMELAPYAKSIVGIDISQGAIDAFNTKAAEAGYTTDAFKGVCVELKGEEGELDGAKFDLITCCAAYHHFADYTNVTQILAKFLKPGGMLCVIDRLAGTDHQIDDHPKEEVRNLDKIVPHKHGLDNEDLLPGFQQAGLQEYSFGPCGDAQWMNMSFKIFLAKGIKPAE